MGKRSFTLVEIMVVVIIVGILATVAIPNYRNFIEDSNAKVCETNLAAQAQALDIYAMEHDQMPGSLSQLPGEYIDRAFAKIMQQKDAWKIKLAYSVVDWQNRGLAYAIPYTDIVKGSLKILTCPNDSSPSATHGSYGVNIAAINISSAAYKALSSDIVLIGDSSAATFSDLSALERRHKHSRVLSAATSFSLGIKKSKEVVERDQDGRVTTRPRIGVGVGGIPHGLTVAAPQSGCSTDEDCGEDGHPACCPGVNH